MEKFKRNILYMCLFCVEFYFLIINRSYFLGLLPYLSQTTSNNYDNITISLIATLIFAVMQGFNYLLVDLFLQITQYSMINILQIVFKYSNDELENRILQMRTFMFSTKCKWGVRQKTSICKYANTAEGLIACANDIEAGIDFNREEKEEIKVILNKLVKEIKLEGYKSINEDVYTVHCTGMVLYALKYYIDAGWYDISEDEESEIRKCLRNLLNNANKCGWGFVNKKYTDIDYNRTLSTLWALKALNVWDYSSTKTFRDVISNVVNCKDVRPGFSVDTTEKYATTAMLHILLAELRDEKLKGDLLQKQNSKKLIKFLLKGLKTEIEVEEYLIEKETEKKLSWIHFTECLTLEALSMFLNEMSLWQMFLISRCIKKIVSKIDKNHHYYIVQGMSFDHKNPFFFPTCYLSVVLCKMMVAIKKVKKIR